MQIKEVPVRRIKKGQHSWTRRAEQRALLGRKAAARPGQRARVGGPHGRGGAVSGAPARKTSAAPKGGCACRPQAPPEGHSRADLSRVHVESLRRVEARRARGMYVGRYRKTETVSAAIRTTPSGIKIKTGSNCKTTAARNQGCGTCRAAGSPFGPGGGRGRFS